MLTSCLRPEPDTSEIESNPCFPNGTGDPYCENGATCILNSTGSPFCVCTPFYFGVRCEIMSEYNTYSDMSINQYTIFH